MTAKSVSTSALPSSVALECCLGVHYNLALTLTSEQIQALKTRFSYDPEEDGTTAEFLTDWLNRVSEAVLEQTVVETSITVDGIDVSTAFADSTIDEATVHCDAV